MEAFRDEFRRSRLGLQCEDPNAFTVSKWQEGSRICGWFLFYRVALAAWSFGVLITSVVHEWDRETAFTDRSYLQFWPIYLTNLAFLGLTVHLILSACVLFERLLEGGDAGATLLVRVSWITYNISTLLGIGITILFWSFGRVSDPRNPLTIIKHGANSLVLLMDLWVSARPCRILHFYQPLCVALCYMLFSFVYWAAGGQNHTGQNYIYHYLDWGHIRSLWHLLALLIFLIFPTQVLIWILHQVRDTMHRRVVERRKVLPATCYDNPVTQTE